MMGWQETLGRSGRGVVRDSPEPESCQKGTYTLAFARECPARPGIRTRLVPARMEPCSTQATTQPILQGFYREAL
jgi:hypothetical protein